MKIEELQKLIADNVAKEVGDLGKQNEEFLKGIEKLLTEAIKPNKDAKNLGGDKIKDKNAFPDMGDFLFAVMKAGRGKVDPRLVQKDAGDPSLEEYEDSQGGFLVPEQFRAELLRETLEKTDLLKMARKIPVATNRIAIPMLEGYDRSGHQVFGGIRLYWEDELDTKTATKPRFGKLLLVLHKLVGLAYCSDELLADSPITIAPMLKSAFGDAFRFFITNAILAGNGAGQPLGILNSPVLLQVTRNTAGTIVFQDVISMWSRLLPSSKNTCIWMANSTCFNPLAAMVSPGPLGIPIWLPQMNVADKSYESLLGRPLFWSEHCPTLGTTGDLLLLDMKNYLIATKAGKGIEFASSMHVRFENDQQTFRWVFRMDGQPILKKPVQPKHGDTLSPFVALT